MMNQARVVSASRFGVPRLDGALDAVSRLFETSHVDARSSVTHLWLLLGIVLAGAWVRFSGLNLVGLHGDEETMAMAVRHILIDGTPILPSGMFYPRGMTQLYLMALSTSIFGESEWSLRLPSALCGIALIGLSYLMGKRFLRPEWNLALAATVAFLPELIIYSQTARMYIFLVTCVTISMVCLFRWERTDRPAWLVGAVVALIFGMDMQLLAVGVVLMFLMPGVLQANTSKVVQGGVAMVVSVIGYVVVEHLTQSQYPVPPQEFAADLGPPPWERSWAPPQFALTFDIALFVTGVTIVFFGLQLVRSIRSRAVAVCSAVLLVFAVGLQLALFYHLAGLFYAAALLLAYRYRTSQTGFRVLVLVFAAAVVTLLHASLLASTPGSIVKLVGAMVGQPSVWPYLRVVQLSDAAGLVVVGLVMWGGYQFVQHRKLSDIWLLAVLAIVAPVFALGFFAWNVPVRYTAMCMPPLLLCAFAAAQRVADWIDQRRARRGSPQTKWQPWAAGVLALLAVNPVSYARLVHAGYELHPDHKGAAEFMQSLSITDNDIVLAEDVLQQTYYLGKVDYWLIGPHVARKFIKREGDGVVDFYTGTPVIATGAMLDALLQSSQGKRVFVIGSGEDQRNRRRGVRGEEIHEALRSSRFEVIHTGRDGLTEILQAVPSKVHETTSPSAQEDSQADKAKLVEEAEALESASTAAPAPVE